MSKRILIVGQHFWPESFRINDIADFFIENGYSVDVLCGKPNYPKGKFLDGYSFFSPKKEMHNSITIYRTFEIPRGTNTNARIFLNYISYPIASLFHLPKLLTKKYDKIFIYQLSPVMMALTGILLGKLKRTETTMYVLDLWPENLFSVLPIKNAFLRRLVTQQSHWYYRHVDKLIAMSSDMKKKLAQVAKNKPIIVLPQTSEKEYEMQLHDNALRKKFRKKNTFNILFTGNISPAQSPDTMLAAAKSLSKSGYKDIHWIIVGDGMSRKQFKAKVKNEKLSSYFSFEGFKPIADIPKYADVADATIGCLVKSDLLEATIPAKVISYLALGKPVLLAMDGEAQDLINNRAKCGYASETNDVDALVKNIIKLHDLDAKKRAELGNRGKKYHATHFERSIILNKLVSFLFE